QEAIWFCMYLAVGATVGLIVSFPAVNVLLFNNLNGTLSLQVMTVSILFTSLSIICCTILQSIGSLFEPALFISAAFVSKLVLNKLLVPLIHIHGSALATVISLFLLAVVLLVRLHKKLSPFAPFGKVRWRPFAFAVGWMTVYLLLAKWVGTLFVHGFTRSQLLLYVLLLVSTGALSYA